MEIKPDECIEWKKLGLNRNQWLWLIINFVFVLFTILFCSPFYETNDDYGLSVIASNAYDSYSEFMIFCNIFLGYLLKFFYFIFPNMNWYVILLYLFMAISFTMLSFIIIDKFSFSLGSLINVGLLGSFALEAYVNIQFTKVGAILTIIGAVTILHYIRSSKKVFIVIGALLVFIGLLYRLESFFIGIAFAVPLALIDLFVINRKEENNKFRVQLVKKVLFQYLKVGIPLLLALLIALGTNFLAYRMNPDWSDFSEYNLNRSLILDYPALNYKEHREEFERIGISENDYNLLYAWDFGDTDVYTTEKYQEILAIKENSKDVLNLPPNILGKLLSPHFFRFALLFLFCCIIVLIFNKKRRGLVLLEILLAGSVWFYLIMAGRLPWRVEYGILLGAIVSILFICEQYKLRKFSIKHFVVIAVGMILLIYSLKWTADRLDRVEERKQIVNTDSVYDVISQRKDEFYLIDTFTVSEPVPPHYPLFSAAAKESRLNSYTLGGWGFQSGHFKHILRRNGITNPMKQFTTDSRFRLICNDVVRVIQLENFLTEHYGSDSVKYQFKLDHDTELAQLNYSSYYLAVSDTDSPIDFDSLHITSPEEGKYNYNLDAIEIDDSSLSIFGWAYLTGTEKPVEKYLMAVNQSTGNVIKYSLKEYMREDVGVAFQNENYSRSGFLGIIDRKEFANENYSLSAVTNKKENLPK